MSADVSRRKALSLIGTAMGLALALREDDALAETASLPRRHQRRTGQRANPPAEAATTEFKPTKSVSEMMMEPSSTGAGLHIDEDAH
jgi:hypothetical protein